MRVRLGSDKRRGRGKQTGAALIFLLLGALAFQVACGGSGSHPSRGTPAGKYMITVTGTYSTGSLVHSTPTSLTVQ
jgi:hypothetical protein